MEREINHSLKQFGYNGEVKALSIKVGGGKKVSEKERNLRVAETLWKEHQWSGQTFNDGDYVALLDGNIVAVADNPDEAYLCVTRCGARSKPRNGRRCQPARSGRDPLRGKSMRTTSWPSANDSELIEVEFIKLNGDARSLKLLVDTGFTGKSSFVWGEMRSTWSAPSTTQRKQLGRSKDSRIAHGSGVASPQSDSVEY